ncbi:short-chain dehydrogenase [Candidatus Magnetomorum sp. HK-1]|nr:short-chain dehydrogenase [Candidatus Magnetomorum sp. HK-1]
MFKFSSNYWALIIGGSSGFGLATAQKLAAHGMNLCIIHRDRRGAMSRIQPSFDTLKSSGVNVKTFNADALNSDKRKDILDQLSEVLGETGKIRMLLHSIAFGNLKLLAPFHSPENLDELKENLARDLNKSKTELDAAIDKAFESGKPHLHTLVKPPQYNNNLMLDKGDFDRTIHSMGSNIVEWVQDIHQRKIFARDARILSLTSEGNSVAWRGYAAISAAKAVLESVSRAMAVEFAPYGLRSNVIQAGVTDTAALKVIPGSEHIKANAILRNPYGRLTQPEDVANVIFLLCMDEAAWINGSLICVDGGERIA